MCIFLNVIKTGGMGFNTAVPYHIPFPIPSRQTWNKLKNNNSSFKKKSKIRRDWSAQRAKHRIVPIYNLPSYYQRYDINFNLYHRN